MPNPYLTTSALVAGVLAQDYNVNIDLTPYITAADDVVTRICSGSVLGYSNATLQIIETWLAAHFYVTMDKDARANQESAGDASQNMGDKKDKGLESTIYGQQALVIESSGALAAMNKRIVTGVPPKPGAMHLGRCWNSVNRGWWWPGGYGLG